MCGIVGIISNRSFKSSTFLASIDHRGPDSNGMFEEGNLWLGHTRLSIQDLSENGNQPMFSSDERYVMVFNGEIYNHMEIRESLNEFAFRSTGDTETVLNAYIKFGVDCVKRLNGIFAFCIYDRKEKMVFIARDHFGVKPLYYYSDEECFAFSSELKSLSQLNINKQINYKALVNYITFLWSPGDMTPFVHVKKLLPGHYMHFHVNDQKDREKIVPFYRTTLNGTYSKDTESELINALDQKLTKAVERQLLSDVPVGFFLSGGLDSTLLVAIAKKLQPQKRFPCFTIKIDSWGNGRESFANDLYYAKKAAKILDVELHVVNADIDIVKDFDKMVWHLDEPQADAAPLNVLNIATLARKKGIKVLIGGAGGDDLFSGYRRHQALKYEKYFEKIPLVFRKGIKHVLRMIPPYNQSVRRLKKLTQNIDELPADRLKGYFKWMAVNKVKELFIPKIEASLKSYDPTFYFDEVSKELPYNIDALNKMLFWEVKTFLVDHNLNYTDKMGMAVGVEARVPYLDIELVEFSNSLPPELKMRGDETKYILKKVAERYLPNEIIYRPKTGFGAPVRKWVTEDMKAMITQRLNSKPLTAQGIFNPDKIKKLITDNEEGKIDASYSIWSILAIDSWINQFILKNEADNTRP